MEVIEVSRYVRHGSSDPRGSTHRTKDPLMHEGPLCSAEGLEIVFGHFHLAIIVYRPHHLLDRLLLANETVGGLQPHLVNTRQVVAATQHGHRAELVVRPAHQTDVADGGEVGAIDLVGQRLSPTGGEFDVQSVLTMMHSPYWSSLVRRQLTPKTKRSESSLRTPLIRPCFSRYAN
jgi:hypothetical protein